MMFKYSRDWLLSLQFWWKTSAQQSVQFFRHVGSVNTVKPLSSTLWNDLKQAGILRKTRGRRGGKFVSRNYFSWAISSLFPRRRSEFIELKRTFSRTSLDIQNLHLRSGSLDSSLFRNTTNLIRIPITSSPSKPKIIPKCLVMNARSLAKPDALPALHCELKTQKADICCVSETWLNQSIPSHLICPEGFSILRKDRTGRQGGGVAIFCRGDWKLERLDGKFSNDFECLWAKISTSNSVFHIAVVYHPPEPQYNADNLIDFLANTCNDILVSDPNSKLIICGDLNQLRYKDLLLQNSLFQMVRSPTRQDKILDVFITNVAHLWGKIAVVKCLIRSDHLMVIASPRVPAKSLRKTTCFRDAREQNKIKMSRGLQEMDWSDVFFSEKVDDKVQLVQDKLVCLYDSCFPTISVRVSSRDPPFVSPLVKHLLNERRKLLRRDGSSMAIQTLIEKINALIRRNQLFAVKNDISEKDKGSKSWWGIVNSITGRKSTHVSISSIVSPDKINDYFCSINTDPNYIDPEILSIPDGTRIPEVTSLTVCNFLLNLKRTTAGPDQLPFWLWRDFAFDLAPIISHVFNCSLRCQTVPSLWKMADIMPLPKETPFKTCTQLRPISLTNIIMRLFERVVFRCELSNVINNSIGSDQFAYR